MILIDTSAMIEFLNCTDSRVGKMVEQLVRHDAANTAIADMTLTEILQGIKNDQEFTSIKNSLLAWNIISLRGTDSYVAAAELYRACRKHGLSIRSTIDCLIAQIAIENNAEVLHNDRDFESLSAICELKLCSLIS